MTQVHNLDALRAQLDQLLHQQNQTLQARMSGSVSDDEILAYDLRQELISEIQNKLARAAAA